MFNYTVYHKFYLSVDFKFNRFNNYNYKLLLKTFFYKWSESEFKKRGKQLFKYNKLYVEYIKIPVDYLKQSFLKFLFLFVGCVSQNSFWSH